MIHPGLVSITFRKLTPQEIVRLARQGKIRGIEWGGDVHVPHGDFARAAEVRRLTEEAGLAVSAYGSYYRLDRSESEGLPFGKVLETALALGAAVIRVWAGAKASATADAGYRRRIVAESLRIADLAAREKVTVAYECHGNTLTDTNESALELLKAAQHPALSTFWQPPVDQAVDYCADGLKSVLPWLRHLHVFFWGMGTGSLPLAEGADRWKRYLRLAQSSGRDHFAELEFVRNESPEAFLEDAATLNRWLEELGA